MRRARSRMDIRATVAMLEASPKASSRSFGDLSQGPASQRPLGRRSRAGAGSLGGLAAPPPLVAMPLDLAGEIVGGLVDRADHVVRRVLRAEGDSLEVEGDLGDLRARDRGVLLLGQLHFRESKVRNLLCDLLEAFLDPFPEIGPDRH